MKTVLTPVEWNVLQEIVNNAADLGGQARAQYLDKACDGVPQLRARAESLLAALTESELTVFSAAINSAASATIQQDLPAIGARLGPYRIHEVVGRGGMGVVYEAFRDDDQYRMRVAVKLVATGLFSRGMLQRFRNERQILASLEHPNIARLLDGGATDGGLPYLVMEFVQGLPLNEYCARHNLALREKLQLIAKIAKAVQYAHQKLVVHRDLKPGNILITEAGEPKLLDFGIAKLIHLDDEAGAQPLTTAMGRMMTLEYASPEQIREQAVTTATDVYQLGVVLFEIATGHLPFQPTKTGVRLEIQICEREAPKPAIDHDLDLVILKALEKEPARRYASAGEFAADLERYLNGYPVQARAASWRYISWRFVRRNRIASIAALLAVLLLTAGVIEMAVLTKRAQTEAATANQITDFVVGLFDSNDPQNGRGDQTTARELLDKAVPKVDQQLKDSPAVHARLLDTMGGIYTRLGDYKEADRLLSESLNIRKNVLKREDLDLVNTLSNIADNAATLGQLGYAESLYREALRISRKAAGNDSDDVAAGLSNLASVLQDEGKLREAETVNCQAVEMRKRILGLNATDTLISMNNLETLYSSEGKYQQAETLGREVLTRRLSIEDKWNRDLGYSWGNLARVLSALGRFNEAEADARKALEVRMHAFPPGHPQIQWGRVMLADVLNDEGKTSEAEAIARQAIATLGVQGEADPHLSAYARSVLGKALLGQGDAAGARKLVDEGMKIYQKAVATDSFQMAPFWERLAEVDLTLGNYSLAQSEGERAVDIYEKALGEANVIAASAEILMAEIDEAQGHWDQALKYAGKALEVDKVGWPVGHPETARAQSVKGWALWKSGKADEAGPLLQTAYQADKTVYANLDALRESKQVAARWNEFQTLSGHK